MTLVEAQWPGRLCLATAQDAPVPVRQAAYPARAQTTPVGLVARGCDALAEGDVADQQAGLDALERLWAGGAEAVAVMDLDRLAEAGRLDVGVRGGQLQGVPILAEQADGVPRGRFVEPAARGSLEYAAAGLGVMP